MLVLSRRLHESIQIGGEITIVVVSISRDKIRLGIEAPKHLPIVRDDAVNQEPTQREGRLHGG